MAHLKKKDWTKAEDDASSALTIDPAHIKSYQRRAAARASLGKLRSALVDLSHAEMEASKQDGNVTAFQKSSASEKRRVEALLKAAMKRAPRRSFPIVFIEGPKKVGKKTKAEKSESASLVVSEDLVVAADDDATKTDDTEQQHPAVARNSESDDGKENKVGNGGNDTSQLIAQTTTTAPTVASSTRKHKKPDTWYEFEATWRSMGSQNERISFLATIKPKKLAALYRNGIEDVDLLVEIISAAARIPNDAADYIKCMANTRCIDIPVMMMTDSHKMAVSEAIEKAFGRRKDDGAIVMSKLCC